MTEKTNFKEPTPEQIKLMNDYNNLCNEALKFISLCEPNHFLQNVCDKLVESIGWFSHYVANGGDVVKCEVKPAPDISPTEAARIVTIN
jgi:hypothetical protein